MNAYLILEDGHTFQGESFGSEKDAICEMVFNTSMTGYEEVLTDPSYFGQGVVMTYPLIGNYGVCKKTRESEKVWNSALVIRELSRISSNFRREDDLENMLQLEEISGIKGVDTRAITKLLREKGSMNGMITTRKDYNVEEVVEHLKGHENTHCVEAVSCKEKQHVKGVGAKIAVLDFGAKKNIIRSLEKRNCDITIFPAWTKAETLLKSNPDGVILTNGPGDPKENVEIIYQITKLMESSVPMMGICLGHQMLALAAGGNTKKMEWGHRGGNHPVKDIKTGKIYMTAQNHGYVVDEQSLDSSLMEAGFINVNDGSIEGIEYKGKPIFSVQFHPEASPGPEESAYLFDQFLEMMEAKLDGEKAEH